jgi:hypothetical protein
LWIVLWETSLYSCLYWILTYIPLGRCPGADHMTVLLLAFWRISILISIMVILICIPINSMYRFLFHIFVIISIEYGHSNWGEMKSCCNFDLYPFNSQGTWTLLCVFIGYLYLFPW